MSSGALQIAAGTQLVVDETVLQSGQLNEMGLRNLAALQGIMQQQKLAYDFQFFTMDQPTDAPITVLSTARTMLKGVGEVVVPLCPTAPTAANGAAVTAAIAGGDVGPSRHFLAAVRAVVGKSGAFSIPEAVAAHVEKDLAGAKQKDPSLTPESFHLRLNLARLLAVSHGEKELTPERWAQALEMENKRQERLPKTVGGAAAAAPTAATA
jgi:Mini-chromosome maintenance replisome factor